jgi:tripartite-type tricarboxylate transporter receptor subunit TctC
MTLTRREGLRLAGAAAASAFLARPANADVWPTHPIKAVIPFTAGATVDIVGRIVLERLSVRLGQPIVVENRGGAGGSIGTAVVAKSDPDGYTMLVHASAHSAAPAAYANLPYDTANDFAAVAAFGTVPNVTVVAPSKGIKTLKELVARAKSGSMTFASAGVGSATHWAAERLRVSAGFNATHIPFRGPESLTEVMAGRVDFMCIGVSAALGFLRSGQLIPLAVSTLQRSRALPDVPTTTELGYANSDYNFWMGMLVPAKTSRDLVDRLYRAIQEVLITPTVIEKFAPQGIEPMPLTPKEFDTLIVREIAANKELVKATGMKVN